MVDGSDPGYKSVNDNFVADTITDVSAVEYDDDDVGDGYKKYNYTIQLNLC